MELFHREYGSGQALVIMHGLFGMSDNWVSLARRLAQQFHVYLPDLRNHGQSPNSSLHSYTAMVGDMEEFLLRHHIENPILMGHSMGGTLAMQLASEHPAVPKKLIVVDMSPGGHKIGGQHLEILQAMMDVDLERIRSRREIEVLLSTRIPDPRIRLFILKNLYRQGQHTFAWRVNLEAIYNNLDLMAEESSLAVSFARPSLFIRGALSAYIPDSDVPLIRKYFPGAEIITIGKAGHWVHADAPDELYAILINQQ